MSLLPNTIVTLIPPRPGFPDNFPIEADALYALVYLGLRYVLGDIEGMKKSGYDVESMPELADRRNQRASGKRLLEWLKPLTSTPGSDILETYQKSALTSESRPGERGRPKSS